MKTRFLFRRFSWKRVGFGVSTGVCALLAVALAFVLLAANGFLTRW